MLCLPSTVLALGVPTNAPLNRRWLLLSTALPKSASTIVPSMLVKRRLTPGRPAHVPLSQLVKRRRAPIGAPANVPWHHPWQLVGHCLKPACSQQSLWLHVFLSPRGRLLP